MKKLFIFILFTVLAVSTANAQGCLPEGITFTTQAQIDSFAFNYPGCTVIEGNVNIVDNNYWGWYDITNLDGLSVITSIGGGLNIRCFALTSLAGLSALTSIGGDLTLGGYNMYGGASGNPLLISLAGLEGLNFIGGNLTIIGNAALVSLAGLENVAASSINNITIQNNGALTNCNIQSICEYLSSPNGTVDIYHNAPGCNSPADIANSCGITLSCLPYGNYYFFSQSQIDNFPTDFPGCSDLQGEVSITGDDIVNLTGLSQVTSVGGNLNIGRYYFQQALGNPLLTSLNGLENLNHIGGTLMIIQNDMLSSLTGLDNLNAIEGDLLIGISYVFPSENMGALASLSALGNLTSIGGELYISGTAITTLDGLDSLSSIGTDITIYSNTLLADISSLHKLTSINGRLYLSYASIEDLEGLNNISEIRGNVYISHNNRLKNLTGMENVTNIGAGAWIYSNDSLATMEGLNNLATIGYLDLWDNPALITLSGLESLDSIRSYLEISYCGVTSLSALEGLQFIGGDLYILNNSNLTSLTGLDNLLADSIANLKLFYNSQLQTCDIQSICDYLADPHGIVEIYSNAPGCNSQYEVETACQVGFEDGDELSFNIMPNPSSRHFTFNFFLPQQSDVEITILDNLGKIVDILKVEKSGPGNNILSWNAEDLPGGVYYFRCQAGNILETGKLILLK